MFCQNCGAKNNDEYVFCENCGAKLEKAVWPVEQESQAEAQPVQETQAEAQPVQQQPAPEYQQPVQQQPAPEYQQPVQQQPAPEYQQPVQQPRQKKPISKLAIVIAVEAVALIALVVGFFKIGQSIYSPEKVAEKFFVEVANQNYKEAYAALDVEETDFINEKAFENAGCNVALNKVTDYKVKRTSGDDDEKEVVISYKLKGNSSKRSYDISVNQQDDKRMLFFDDWKVSPDSMIAQDFEVVIPVGAEVTVDGVKLGKEYIDKEDNYDESLQCFKIPELFAGEHQIIVTQEGMEEVRALVNTDEYGYYLYDMYPSEEEMEAVLDKASSDFKSIYEAAADGKDFAAVADLFSSDEECQEEARDDFEALKENFAGNSYSVINRISVSNLEMTAYPGYYDTDEFVMEVYLEFDYELNYTETWFDEVTNETYDSSDYFYVDYVYENGEWKLVEFIETYLYY